MSISEAERQKRLRELEIIRGILIAVMTIIVTGLALWMIPA